MKDKTVSMQHSWVPGVRRSAIPPSTPAFTILLAVLAALPSFGIDMSLPALNSIGVSLYVSADKAGLTMSLFMIGFAGAPLVFGPVSDKHGRRPVALFASALFSGASIGGAAAQSLQILLLWRIMQGAGAGIGMAIALTIIRDLFEGESARTKMSYVVVTMLGVPMIAPTAGTIILMFSGWRGIYGVLAGVGILLFVTILLGLAESATQVVSKRLGPMTALRDYRQALSHPVAVGYMLTNAAAFGALFAYVSGSSLFFIGDVGFSFLQYSLVFALSAIGIMAGAFINGRLSARGVAPFYPLTAGLCAATVAAVSLLCGILFGRASVSYELGMMLLSNIAFGLIAPNTTQGAMQPLPEIAGATSAAMGCLQMMAGSASSAIVVSLGDGHSALSMAVTMALCSILALTAYIGIVRPAERRQKDVGVDPDQCGMIIANNA